MTLAEHRNRSQRLASVWIATLSDTRTPENDTGGDTIEALVEAAGHRVLGRSLLREDNRTLADEIRQILSTAELDVLICTGGTGVAPRDIACEHLQRLYERSIPGFGELFRMLSWQEIGSAALLSRASAGICGKVLIFSLPGSRGAIELAMRQLILPELMHLLGELERSDAPGEPS